MVVNIHLTDTIPRFMRNKKLSIIVPLYNEAGTILILLESIFKAQLPEVTREVIVVDDHSKDGSADLVREFAAANPAYQIVVVSLLTNAGKGHAIRKGLQKVTGDFVLIQDADLEYSPDDYKCLLEPILNEKADVVYGSRFIGGKPHRVLFFWHSIGNKFLTFVSNMFSNINMTDMETGMKLFRAEVLKHVKLKENRFGFEPEVTAKLSRIKGIRMYEVGISYYGRTYEEGKKINWKDGFRALYCILKYGMLRR